MEQTIKRLARQFAISYAAYILAALLFWGIYEALPEAKGSLTGSPAAQYALDTVCIMLTLLIVPLSVKAFAAMLTRHKSLSFDERATRYRMLWNVRIACFAIVTIFDLWAYNATLNNIGGFCALICIVTSLLFVPTQKRIAADLNPEK